MHFFDRRCCYAGTTIYATVNNRYNTYNFGGRKVSMLVSTCVVLRAAAIVWCSRRLLCASCSVWLRSLLA